jgi:hypothetical protein
MGREFVTPCPRPHTLTGFGLHKGGTCHEAKDEREGCLVQLCLRYAPRLPGDLHLTYWYSSTDKEIQLTFNRDNWVMQLSSMCQKSFHLRVNFITLFKYAQVQLPPLKNWNANRVNYEYGLAVNSPTHRVPHIDTVESAGCPVLGRVPCIEFVSLPF